MSWADKARAKARRGAKHLGQIRFGWGRDKRLGFVFGCQRSGTKMMMRVLDRSDTTRIYHEDDAAAFEDFQLRPDWVVKALVTASPAPCQLLKPICDSHHADRLLDRFEGARAVWLFRDPDAVAASAVSKWGAHQAEVIDALVAGSVEPWGWRAEDVPEAVVQALTEVHRPDLSPEEGALLFWYLRNRFFFELGLHQDPRVRLVSYARLVEDPRAAFPPVFAHLGARFEPEAVDRVHARSSQRAPLPASQPIRALCEGLLDQLEAAAIDQPAVPLPSPVMMVINTLGTGGAERYVVTVSNWLVDQGAEVVVVSSGGEQVPLLDPRVRHEELDLVRVRGELPSTAMDLRALIREVQPAVIVAHSLVASWVGRVAQLRRRVPIVTVAHGWPEPRYKQVGRLIGVADKVVAVSPEVQRKLTEGGLAPQGSVVIYNGVDTRGLGQLEPRRRDQVRASLGVGPQDLLVINVGRLSDQKAQHHILDVADRLRDRCPRYRYVLVGEGEREDELAALLGERRLAGIATLAGLRSDVPELLGAADVFFSSSDWEGMPLTTIEAMASELAVLATRTEGADQLLDERCALVVPVGDPSAMAEALAKLHEDDARRRSMGRHARDRALAHFSHERMSSELAEVLRRVAG